MQVTWMILDTIFSLRRIERLSPTSYHLAKTACESTPCGKTIKRVFGGAVCSLAHQSLTQLYSDGRWEAQQKTSLAIDWMDGKPAPEAVLELLACRCPRSCGRSDCERPNMYTDLCWLQDCENQAAQEDVKVIFMEIARRRMKVVTEKSTYILDTPLLCSLASVQA